MKRFAYYFIALWFLIALHETNAAQFYSLGYVPGRTSSSTAKAVSDDGSVVVGYSSGTVLGDDEAFRWTLTGGIVGLGDLPGGIFDSRAYGVSADGSIVVGQGSGTSGSGGPGFRWTSTGGMAPLGYMPGGTFTIANGISANGAVVVGYGDSSSGTQALRWTTTGGAVGLGVLSGASTSSAHAASADGSVIVGQSNYTPSGYQAFRWTSTGGMTGLGYLSGGYESSAQGVSASGAVVVGTSNNGSEYEAFRWTSTGGIAGLGHLYGGTYSSATAVSADGSIVVGQAASDLDTMAFIWDSTNGMRDLKSVLQTDYGLDISGWTLYYATAISANGRAICGNGIGPSGVGQAWLVLLDPLQLNWRRTSGGNWDTPGNWDFSHQATSMTDVTINPNIGLTVTGPADAATIKSLTIGTSTIGVVTLSMQSGGTMNVDGATTIGPGGRIAGSGTFNAAGGIYNSGEIDLGAGTLQLTGDVISNNGVIRGSGSVANILANNPSGEVRLSTGDRMVFSAAGNSNAGKIEVLGGEIEFKQGLNNQETLAAFFARNAILRFGGTGLINSGSLDVTFGTTDVFGNITNDTGAEIILTGKSSTTFYDDVTNNGSLKVSQGSTAVFFGDLQGTHATGTVFIEGGLVPGISGASLQLAGILPGAGIDNHHANITNNSPIGLIVTGTNYSLGAIDGVGNTIISGNSSLTVDSIAQNTLTIGPGGILTIAPLASGPLGDTGSLRPSPNHPLLSY